MIPLNSSDLDQFSNSESFYRHALFRKIVYTEGVQFLAEHGHAYWLIDAIASHLLSSEFNRVAAKDSRARLLHFWNLAVDEDQTADLTGQSRQRRSDIHHTADGIHRFSVRYRRQGPHNGQSYTLMLPS